MGRHVAIFLLAGSFIQFPGFTEALAQNKPLLDPGFLRSVSLKAALNDAADEALHLPVELHPSIEAYIGYFTSDGKAGLQTWFNNSGIYLPVMKEIFRHEHLPEELAYVAMIESGLDPRAISRANAVGFWQLMPDTARQYRLRGDRWIDERRDLVKSTRAAARHFRFLRARLNSWPLVFAAYNAGLTTVRRAIRETGSDDFWVLRKSGRLARETNQFVPKIMAVVLIARDASAFGFRVPPPRPVPFDTVSVPAGVDLWTLARAIGTSYEKISSLNPEMSGFSTPPHGASYLLKIPKGKKKAYLRAGSTAFAATDHSCGSLCHRIANKAIPVSVWLTNPSAYDGIFTSKQNITEKLLLIGFTQRRRTALGTTASKNRHARESGIQNSRKKPDSRSPTKPFEDKFHGNYRYGQKVILSQVLQVVSLSDARAPVIKSA